MRWGLGNIVHISNTIVFEMPFKHSSPKRWRLGTRGSPLALVQAEEARRRLCSTNDIARDLVELYPISTTGDRRTDRPLADLGGKGLFAKEIDAALLAGSIDIAIHSAKDLPGELPRGIAIAAALPREDPLDCLICEIAATIRHLPRHSRIGTCSPRRQAQLLHLRPDVEIAPVRGNVGTRLASVAPDGPFTATVLAAAGLRRLGIRGPSIRPIGAAEMLPAVGQGVITALVREDDENSRAVASRMNDPDSACALAAERSLLRALEGDCRSPIAGLALVRNGRVLLEGEILKLDGSERIRDRLAGPIESAASIGETLASALSRSAGPDFWEPMP